jgi:protein-S-isoprenylcysteine O-methyltransferase Ste14
MWLSPDMTVNLLTTFGLFSIYMYVATFHEERRLIAEFGDRYRAYQRHVGRFVPRLFRRSTQASRKQ